MNLFTSLSPQEEYALTGTLTQSTIEKLLEMRSNVDELEDVIEGIEDAFADQAPKLERLTDYISVLENRSKAANVTNIRVVIDTLQDFVVASQYRIDTAQHTLDDLLPELRKLYEA